MVVCKETACATELFRLPVQKSHDTDHNCKKQTHAQSPALCVLGCCLCILGSLLASLLLAFMFDHDMGHAELMQPAIPVDGSEGYGEGTVHSPHAATHVCGCRSASVIYSGEHASCF